VSILNPDKTQKYSISNISIGSLKSGTDVRFGVITSPGQYHASITVNGVTKEAPFIIEFGKPTVTNIMASSFDVQADVYGAVLNNPSATFTISIEGGIVHSPILQTNNFRPSLLQQGTTINFTFNGQPNPAAGYYVYIAEKSGWVQSETSADFTIPVPGPTPA
jgi:hypothetical protein